MTKHTPMLLETLRDVARTTDRLAAKLSSTGYPGHADYISKADAAIVAQSVADAARAAIQAAEEAEANARLLALALDGVPEDVALLLLEALRELADYAEHKYEAAIAAIRKATED